MPSTIRPQDAVTLYSILVDPGNGADNLNDLINILKKCMGVSYDLDKGRGGHSGGTFWVTPADGARIQLFTYTTKSETREKVDELKTALRPVAATLTDENLRRAFQFADQGAANLVTAASFVPKSETNLV